jgi:hypothetical protein
VRTAATARDRRNFFYCVNHVIEKMKIGENTFSFFSTLNQYFRHIPYVASKKRKILKKSTFHNSKHADPSDEISHPGGINSYLDCIMWIFDDFWQFNKIFFKFFV